MLISRVLASLVLFWAHAACGMAEERAVRPGAGAGPGRPGAGRDQPGQPGAGPAAARGGEPGGVSVALARELGRRLKGRWTSSGL